MRKCFRSVILLLFFLPALLLSEVPENMFGTGFHIGFGMPKTPYKYRNPISLTGGLNLHKSIAKRFMLQVNGNALTTFHLGTVNNTDGDLTFDLLWGSVNALYKVSGRFTVNSYIGVGGGLYRLYQKYDNDVTNTDTYGINLGLCSFRPYSRVKTFFDMRWHLIFEPDPMPQLLTVTFGFLL